MLKRKIPNVGETWVHHSGRRYSIVRMANVAGGVTSSSTRSPMVVYFAQDNPQQWLCQRLNSFLGKFEWLRLEEVGGTGASPA